jgi:hypothetical protein
MKVIPKRAVCTTFDIYVRIIFLQHNLIYCLRLLVTEKLVYYGEYIIIVKTIRSLHVFLTPQKPHFHIGQKYICIHLFFLFPEYIYEGLWRVLAICKNKTGLSE